jgi:hypothetical protein
MKLEIGDIFCVGNSSSWVSRSICFFEKLYSSDKQAIYSHSGIITSNLGNTLEMLGRGFECQNIYDEYIGEKIFISRYIGTESMNINSAIQKTWEDYNRKIYPYWRLLVHSLPYKLRFDMSGIPVCSEMVQSYLDLIKNGNEKGWHGWNPDMVSDECHNDKNNFVTIYEGELKGIIV